VPAAGLVTNDIVKLSLGTVVPADVDLIDGSVLLDQSMLTGESVATESGAGAHAFAGALVRRGEALAKVVATGNAPSSDGQRNSFAPPRRRAHNRKPCCESCEILCCSTEP